MIPLLLLLAAGEINIKITPEPLAVTRARVGDVKGLGVWRMVACSAATEPVRVSALAVEMAVEDVSIIDPESAAAVIRSTPSARRRDRIVSYLMFGGIAAAGLVAGNYIQISGREAGMVALGLDLVNRARGKLEQGAVVLDPGKLLTGTIELAPGECTSRIVFAGLVPRGKLRPYAYQMRAPSWRRPPIAGVSSIRR